jgi:undecaprenyl-diphosphatase
MVALAAQYFKAGVNPVDFALFLHIGTLASALVFYWRDWTNVLLLKDWRLIRFLLITTVISLPVGFVIYKTITFVPLGTGLLLLTGVGLLFTAYFAAKKISFNLNKTKLALISGFLQGIAVIPGFSRSGSTIFGLSLGTLEAKEVLRLSYLMSVPAVAASTGYLLIFKTHGLSFSIWPAVVSSFVVGLLSLKVLTRVSQKINFSRFALAFAALCFLGALLEIFVK